MLSLAQGFHSLSKISNTIYYLCRCCPPFRQALPFSFYSHNLCLFTDLFIFGVALCPQSDFIDHLLQLLPQLDIDRQRQYVMHYLPILLQPDILFKRNRDRLLGQLLIHLRAGLIER